MYELRTLVPFIQVDSDSMQYICIIISHCSETLVTPLSGPPCRLSLSRSSFGPRLNLIYQSPLNYNYPLNYLGKACGQRCHNYITFCHVKNIWPLQLRTYFSKPSYVLTYNRGKAPDSTLRAFSCALIEFNVCSH